MLKPQLVLSTQGTDQSAGGAVHVAPCMWRRVQVAPFKWTLTLTGATRPSGGRKPSDENRISIFGKNYKRNYEGGGGGWGGDLFVIFVMMQPRLEMWGPPPLNPLDSPKIPASFIVFHFSRVAPP